MITATVELDISRDNRHADRRAVGSLYGIPDGSRLVLRVGDRELIDLETVTHIRQYVESLHIDVHGSVRARPAQPALGRPVVSRRRVKVVDRGDTFVLKGWNAHQLAREAGVKAVYNGVAAGWVGDAGRLADLCAFLGYRNVSYEVVIEGGDAA